MIYDQEIDEFTVHMEHKLLVHKAKGGVERLDVGELTDMLKDEVAELYECIIEDANKEDIISECADIANFAMFIATKVKETM